MHWRPEFMHFWNKMGDFLYNSHITYKDNMTHKDTKKPFWNSELHNKALNLITGLYETNPEEFQAISDASHKLLEKYTNPKFLSDEVKTILNDTASGWHFDNELELVNIEGTLGSSTLGIKQEGRYIQKETKKETERRLKIAQVMKDVKFGYCRYFSIRHTKISRFDSNIPRKVLYHFDCSDNKLTSLKGGPDWTKNYDCADNKLTSLDHIAKHITGDLKCSRNEITTLSALRGIDKINNLDCASNKLRDLVGCPKSVKKLNVANNELVSMRGASIELTLRDIFMDGNTVSSKSLKLAFNAMKAASGDYSKGLLKIWKKIPKEDQIHMYLDLPPFSITQEEIKKLLAFKNYLSIKHLI